MPAYVAISDKARSIPNVYVGVANKARRVINAYVGDENGKAQLFFSTTYHEPSLQGSTVSFVYYSINAPMIPFEVHWGLLPGTFFPTLYNGSGDFKWTVASIPTGVIVTSQGVRFSLGGTANTIAVGEMFQTTATCKDVIMNITLPVLTVRIYRSN